MVEGLEMGNENKTVGESGNYWERDHWACLGQGRCASQDEWEGPFYRVEKNWKMGVFIRYIGKLKSGSALVPSYRVEKNWKTGVFIRNIGKLK